MLVAADIEISMDLYYIVLIWTLLISIFSTFCALEVLFDFAAASNVYKFILWVLEYACTYNDSCVSRIPHAMP